VAAFRELPAMELRITTSCGSPRSRWMSFSLPFFHSAQLKHEPACDHISQPSVDLYVEILSVRTRSSKFQRDTLRSCMELSVTGTAEGLEEATDIPAAGMMTDTHERERSDCNSSIPATSTHNGPMVLTCQHLGLGERYIQNHHSPSRRLRRSRRR
jgi:hypothetical protein